MKKPFTKLFIIFFNVLSISSVYGLGEKVPFALIKRILPYNPIILEAGAQFGEDTTWMSEFWPEGKIYAFEPSPDSFIKLTKVAEQSSNILIYQLALSEKPGTLPFYLAGGASSLLKPTLNFNNDYFHADLDHPILVKANTLDSWATENNITKIDFMWLDMEGNELKALKSGEDILQTVKLIYTEINLQTFWEGTVLYEVLKKWLEEHNFVEIWNDITPNWHGNALFYNQDA